MLKAHIHLAHLYCRYANSPGLLSWESSVNGFKNCDLQLSIRVYQCLTFFTNWLLIFRYLT